MGIAERTFQGIHKRKGGMAVAIPLIRHAPHDTFSRKGRRRAAAIPHFFSFVGSFTFGIVSNSTL
jgi:hypothetical protein